MTVDHRYKNLDYSGGIGLLEEKGNGQLTGTTMITTVLFYIQISFVITNFRKGLNRVYCTICSLKNQIRMRQVIMFEWKCKGSL